MGTWLFSLYNVLNTMFSYSIIVGENTNNGGRKKVLIPYLKSEYPQICFTSGKNSPLILKLNKLSPLLQSLSTSSLLLQLSLPPLSAVLCLELEKIACATMEIKALSACTLPDKHFILKKK